MESNNNEERGEQNNDHLQLTRRNYDSRRVSKSILKDILTEIHKVNNMSTHNMSKVMNIQKAEAAKEEGIMNNPVPKNKMLKKSSSMTSLIMWNITKALELKPTINLKHSIREAKQRLDQDTDGREISNISTKHPEEQYLLFALLAWQQLGHNNADSLYRFVEQKTVERETSKNQNRINDSLNITDFNRNPDTQTKSVFTRPSVDGTFGIHTSGPILRLPVETCVMRVCSSEPQRKGCRSPSPSKSKEREVIAKLTEACCLNEKCAETLSTLDATITNLRSRAGQLARREAKRVQLLERAENAWTDLEAGYQKRLAFADEKAAELKKEIQKMKKELEKYQDCCPGVCKILKVKQEEVKSAREELSALEEQVCKLASTKLWLIEKSAKGEAAVAQEQCKVAQYERDLKFQEEQARRQLAAVQHEAEGARMLTIEAERAMRAELAGLRNQVEDISNELLAEDKANMKIKEEHVQLRAEKMGLIEDLEGCKKICDKKMQGQLDELMMKKQKLLELQELVLKCQCQMPVNEMVQVKRTPSLAAMCLCAPEDNLEESCSCTSMRERLLTSLLSDLFGGLQNELGQAGSQMPCQLLKCLQDTHNWDRRSDVKTNLRDFFSNLLKSELDIAIATSIENYHARWVGTACADAAKMEPTAEDDLKGGWQERAIERRAQQMANQLAAELLQEHVDEIEKRTLARQKAELQPCTCKKPTAGSKCKPDCDKDSALFPCLTQPMSPFIETRTTNTSKLVGNQHTETSTAPLWMQAAEDVTQLKLQIEDLKKDSVKKEDLEQMKDNISNIIREAMVIDNENLTVDARDTSKCYGETKRKETKPIRAANRDGCQKNANQNKLGARKQKETKSILKKGPINEKPTKLSKNQDHDQSFAVNLCLCGQQKKTKSVPNPQLSNNGKNTWKPRSLKDVMPHSSNVKRIKPINFNLQSPELLEDESVISELCQSNCKCFHKMPSNTSIDKLLQTLASCNFDLVSRETCLKHIKSCLSNCSESVINEAVRALSQNDSKNIFSFLAGNYKMQVNGSDIITQTDSKDYISIITESTQNKENISDNYEDTQMKSGIQSRSFSKQPATSDSEYMGTVFLDKSHENICKCLMHLVESSQGNNQEKNEDCYNNTPFQCINTNTRDCSLCLEMQKNNKTAQTGDQNRSNQCQGTQSNDVPKCNEVNCSEINRSIITYLNSQKELKQKSDLNNILQNTELISSGGEYGIKFLGVTLNDLNTKRNKNFKTVDHDVEDLINPNKKHVVCGTKLPNLSGVEQSYILTKLNVLPKEIQTEGNHSKKYECKAKFEEFTNIMNNYFDDQLLKKSHKDKVVDTRNLKNTEINTMESCVCFNNVNDSGDLEVNAFHLLEDHLKEKMEEFKFSCNKCILPDEEQKLFSTIKQRVKQVISDYANKMKCGCSKGVPCNGSWNRVYGLLQEYLKTKIKRVQCLCVLNDNTKDAILPEVLDKVCNLIENDFQRLRDLCVCKHSMELHTKIVRIGDVEPPTELPEKDTTISEAKYNDVEVQLSKVKKYSNQKSNNTMVLKENMSSQVNPTFRMEAKSCDIMGPYSNRNIKITETDPIITNNKSNGVMVNTCDCCYNTDKVTIRKIPEIMETKEVLVNLYAEQAIDTNDICENPTFHIEIEPSGRLSAGRVNKTISIKEMYENDERILDPENEMVNKQTPCAPYIGFTVDCNCDKALGSCFCMKSVVSANNDKIGCVWKELLESKNNNKHFPYIMHGTQIINNDDVVTCQSIPGNVMIDESLTTALPNDNVLTRHVETIVETEDDIDLKYCHETANFNNNAANTFEERLSLDTTDTCSNSDVYQSDWFKTPIPVNSGRLNAVKLANSIYFPELQIDSEKNDLISGSSNDPNFHKLSETCSCEKVPICHVKMLVKHIEKNLIEFKCTCDSLISKACPVHSKRIF